MLKTRLEMGGRDQKQAARRCGEPLSLPGHPQPRRTLGPPRSATSGTSFTPLSDPVVLPSSDLGWIWESPWLGPSAAVLVLAEPL